MKERRAASSWIGGVAGVIVALYGAATWLGYDFLANTSPAAQIGAAAIIFGGLMVLWAFKLMGADTVTMIVGVVAALIVVGTFVRDGKTFSHEPVTPKVAIASQR